MQLRGACVAVTGATGFLGRHVADELLARGARVVGVVRNPERVPELAARIELRQADLRDRALLAAGFAGTDAVVSNAALFSLRNRRWQDHQEANVRGTANVFDALADAGVRCVVHVSSVAVYAAHQPLVAEDAPQLTAASRRTATNVYSISKAVSEQLAWRKAAEHALELTTVRPCAIYGAVDPNFTPVFRRLVGLPMTVMPAWARIPLVYAGDVAGAIAQALERPASVGRAYNVTGDDLTLWEFARAWREAGGQTAAHAAAALPVRPPLRPRPGPRGARLAEPSVRRGAPRDVRTRGHARLAALTRAGWRWRMTTGAVTPRTRRGVRSWWPSPGGRRPRRGP